MPWVPEWPRPATRVFRELRIALQIVDKLLIGTAEQPLDHSPEAIRSADTFAALMRYRSASNEQGFR